MKYNIIIVDDHKMFLDGLISILKSEDKYQILLSATNAEHIIKYLKINSKEKIDLIITDISMPHLNGLEFIKLLKEQRPNLKVLVVSMGTDQEIVNSLLDLDINGYVPKNAEKKELYSAIEAILKGEKYFSSEIKTIIRKNNIQKKQSEDIKLNQREIDILTLIAQEFTTQEIADKLFLSKYTVDWYRKNLIAKLNVRNLAGLTKFAIKMKYIKG
ncbi:response regulator transcription factor [Aquimarina algicola]|uniref:Response regulator transcription factor n=1 Tax=Aquimarina algicola TaxID=2589995 RepID=A0A504IZ69_9FLAO|nr:response regulator transcription factor [Aquimarina algicola]TPN83404.1 response regulator transcription factor [Aquimarina algicola]